MDRNRLKKGSKTNKTRVLKTTNYIYYLEVDQESKLKAVDDVSGFGYFSIGELSEMIDSMKNLSDKYRNHGGGFEWRDFGKIYSYHHALALKYTLNKKN